MSYIEDKITIQEYLNNIQNRGKKSHTDSILNQFNVFCKQKYDKSSQQIMDDLFEEIKKVQSNDKVYALFNQFKDWLLVDHPELEYGVGRNNTIKKTIKKRHPNTVHLYLIKIRSIFEEIGHIEINSRLFNKSVKVPKAQEEDPEPFTKEQMRLLLDRCSNNSKLKYMVMKDTGCRVGELVQLRKSDIDLSNPTIMIKIQADYTKTKKARTVFITRETAPMLKRLLVKKKDDDLIFGTSSDPFVATGAEKTLFAYYRKQLAEDYPDFGKIYQSNGRHQKTIHSIRSFTATQCAEAIDHTWGHSYVGHKENLGQYIRNQDKKLEKFLRSENHLMVYESTEVVDQDERVRKLEEEQQKSRLDMIALTNIMTEIAEIKANNIRKDIEIQHLQNLLGKSS